MITAMIESTEPVFHGIPSFFRYLVADAMKSSQKEFSIAGQELARHTSEYIEGNEDNQDERMAQLEKYCQAEAKEEILSWYGREFPRCVAIIPESGKHSFVDGVIFAYEEGIMG